jgi:hypothetical protein
MNPNAIRFDLAARHEPGDPINVHQPTEQLFRPVRAIE